MSAVSEAHEGGQDNVKAHGGVLGFFFGAVKFVAGVFLCLTPLTAILALGWLTRFLRREIALTLVRKTNRGSQSAKSILFQSGEFTSLYQWPNWIRLERDTSETGWFNRFTGALWLNFKSGLGALLALAILSLPYGLLWLFAWWAGWENSFNKGYEQSYVGPLIAFSGIAVALVVWTYMPLALAHQAAEGRWRAFFDFTRVGQLIRFSTWRLIWLAVLYLLVAAGLFLAKSAPVFMEKIHPPILDYSDEQLKKFIEGYSFWITFYVFGALLLLRRVIGRIYSLAVLQAMSVYKNDWESSFVRQILNVAGEHIPDEAIRKPWWVGVVVRMFLVWMIWLAVVFLIFAGQFFNHAWIWWVQHPLFQLPWFPGPNFL